MKSISRNSREPFYINFTLKCHNRDREKKRRAKKEIEKKRAKKEIEKKRVKKEIEKKRV